MSVLGFTIVLLAGFLLGVLFQIGGEIAVEIYRVRKNLKRLQQKTQAEQLKEAEATTV